MNKIAYPLNSGTTGAELRDLQDALQLLLDRRVILADDEAAREELSRALMPERANQTYGTATSKLVSLFQKERRLEVSGEVDGPTANALNAVLEDLGAFDREPAVRFYIVSGMLRREDGLPLRDIRVRAAHEAGQRSVRLGEDVTDAEGRYTIRYELLPGIDAIHLRVSASDEDGRPLQASDLIRNAKPLETIDLATPMAARPVAERHIEGTIVLEHGVPADKLKLRLYRRGFGGQAMLLGETTTLAGGEYAFTYEPGDTDLSLEVRAVDEANRETTLSKPLNDLSREPRAKLNLLAPKKLQPPAAEYRRLSADLTPQVGQMTKLLNAKENDSQQDLTVLNRATGWDARLIALAATTERLCADLEVHLPQKAVYGLLRAGLPSDKLLLAQVEPDDAKQALTTVRDAGIVELSDDEIVGFKNAFTTFSNAVRLNIPAPGSRSTYGALLKTSGLPQEAQDKFVPVYLNHRGTAAQLWEKARAAPEAGGAGLDDAQIGRLQLQGKFAFLAGNSETMITRLLDKELNDPVQLVGQDFHRSEAWSAELFGQAGVARDRFEELTTLTELTQDQQQELDEARRKLESVVPTAYSGEDVEPRLEAYAEDMARKVRLSYPTQVVGRLMETEETFKLPAAHDATVSLLKSAAGQGFRLGETPVAAFLKNHTGVTVGMADADALAAQRQLQTLQRVYQITPNNEAMPVLMMAYSEAEFVSLFEARYLEQYAKPPAPGLAKRVRCKAHQVSSVTYNLFTIAKKLDSDMPVAGMSAPVEMRESAKNELIKQFPTMESLFGSMDFCECEHCRSVLSPAAYLVDLLQFVDPEEWGNYLAFWNATHNGQEYPHTDADGNPMKPYDVLIERRPDLPHIPLTCENTHTALPYIDIVNEILEYYVAHGKLEEKAAHDTGEATTEELLAEPQNVIREAYDKLREASYPLNLPFDLWIETAREFCDYFETPLHRVLEAFRLQDDLYAPGQMFDWAAIFMESLELSPAEAAILSDPNPLAAWYELYGFGTESAATTAATDATTGNRIDLNSAKALSRRLGVTYKEIAQIVQTGFVNPELSKLSLLYKLGVSIADARFYHTHKAWLQQDPATLDTDEQKQRLEVEAFSQELAELATSFKMPAAQLDAAIQAIPFNRVLVLADPNAGCNFDLTTLQYSDGTKADPIVFLRINLFVRLWRKLGWSIEETDRALQSFVPRNAPFEAARLAQQPLRTALIYLAHLKTLDEALKVGKQSRVKLLTLWSDIATSGKKPLYAQLFLTRSVLKVSPVFDHPLGRYLQYLDDAAGQYKPYHWDASQPEDPATGNVALRSHLLALQAALGLTADEIGRILEDSGKSLDRAELSLPNVSLLHRYGLLAKALRLTVSELIALKQLSGLDPFKPLYPDPLATLDQDHPFSQTLEFVEAAGEVERSGLKIEDLDYLLRHRFDETGKYRPDREGTLALLKSLSEGVRAIRAEHAVPDDPSGPSDEVLRQKLGLALPPDVVERFLAMVNTTVEFTATRSDVNPADELKLSAFAAEERIREIRYKEVPHKEQKLTVRGVLLDPDKIAIQARFDAVLTVPQKLVFAELLNGVLKQARIFFDNQINKQELRLEGEAGFLEDADFIFLFSPLEPLKEILPADTQSEIDAKLKDNEEIEKKNQEALLNRRYRVAQAFLPFLQQRLIRQFIVQTMTAYTGADPALVESLVNDERLLAVGGSQPLLASFAGTGERGVSAAFFDSDDLSGGIQAANNVMGSADTSMRAKQDTAGNPLNTANSAHFEGYLEVPTPGAYRFYIELDKQNAEAELCFPHRPEAVFLKGVAADDTTLGDQPNEFLELKAGVLYRYSLDLKKLGGGEARLLVQGETLPKGPVSQLTLYPGADIDLAERASTLLNKALQLVQSLGLSEREIRYLLTHATDFDNVSLSDLPTRAVGDTPAEKTAARQRFGRFRRLAAYARLKRDLASATDDLIGIFEANGTTADDRLEKQVFPLIAKLTRRDEATVKAAAEALFAAPAFASEKPVQRLWEALQVAQQFGVPPASLPGWAAVVNGATMGDQRFAIARDLKDTIKARFEPESWQRVAQPIFDKLRQRQRDALVSHVMHQHGFDRLQQLYEYFLIDPGMEPVVQTSRIRLAISSLQLFVQRCLLNLETKVAPSVINAKHWEWMKRYRVWEANRKIFLFPENWLEPEFRDDKTHLFAELEGALLQGDVSSDLVEDAFLNYLKKLDELARLDVVAMHIEDNPDPAGRTLHVFGRTYSQPHKYFYRRYAHQMWTPWEPVSAEIEGDHLVPVVWRDRLYLFWVTFMDKPVENGEPNDPTISLGASNHAVIDSTDTKMSLATSDQKVVGDTKLVNLTLTSAVDSMLDLVADKTIEIQLHWSEYLRGEWSTRESGGYSADTVISKIVPRNFNPHSVFIHVSKSDEADEERGVYIHLGGGIDRAFYLEGRNSAPENKNYSENRSGGAKPENPYSANSPRANRYSGSGAFKVSFQQRIATGPGKTRRKAPSKANPSILQRGRAYKVLPCDNKLTALGVSEEAIQDAANPDAVKAAIESGLGEIASLMKPVFYQDNQHTLFVEPNVTERTIEQWDEWVARTPQPELGRQGWKEVVVTSQQTRKRRGSDPRARFSVEIGRESLIAPRPTGDWLVNPATVLGFDDVLIGPAGQPGLRILAGEVAEAVAVGGMPVSVNPGSELSAGDTVVLEDATTLEQSGLIQAAGGLNVVGNAGFNSALAQNFNDLNREGFGAGGFRAGRIGR